MKRLLRPAALLLLAAILAGCGRQEKASDADIQPAQTVLPAEGITALSLSDDGQVMRFRRDGEVWYWQDDETFPLDQTAMPALLEAAAAMTAAAPVQEAQDLSAYGLDDAQISLSVTADGETLTFTRGDQAASGDWYLRCAEDESVRLVSDNTVKVFQLLDGSIYDLAVLPQLPSVTADTLHAATIQGSAGDPIHIRVVDGMRKVGTRDVTAQTAALLTELSQLAVTSCVDYDPAEGAAAVCGLDTPDAVLTVTYAADGGKEETLTLTVGAPIGDGGRYVTLSGDTSIYRMEETSLVQLLTLAETGLN